MTPKEAQRSRSLRHLLAIARAAIHRLESPEKYHAMQGLIAEAALDQLEFEGVALSASRVLELGCGEGGYSSVLARRSAELIVSDRVGSPVVSRLGLPFVPVDVRERFPFEDDAFDLVFCASVIEHIQSPDRMLAECRRVVKPGGALYLSFPPFYSLFLVGGHQFKPFHLLGERVALGIYNWRHGVSLRSYAEESEGLQLFPLTIDGVCRQIARHFEIKNIFTRLVRLNTARWPGFLKDLATWHVCYLATKPMIRDVHP